MIEQYRELSQLLGISIFLLLLAIIWSMIWKGIALWKAARKNSLPWFIALLVINTLGILEILYIYLFSKMSPSKAPKTEKISKRKRRK